MKRLGLTFLIHAIIFVIVWFLGLVLVSDWYFDRFGRPFAEIWNYSALPAVSSACICIGLETVMWKFSVNAAAIVMVMFVLRVMLIGVLSAAVFFISIAGSETTKIDKVVYVISVFLFYILLLSAHVFSNVVDNKLEEKHNK